MDDQVIELIQQFLKSRETELQVEDIEAAARLIHRCTEEVIHSLRLFPGSRNEEAQLSELEHMFCRYLFGVPGSRH
jgi:hypothetical protein